MNARARAAVDYGLALSREYRRTRASLAAGGLAYFVALSLAPAALAFGTLAGLLLDPEDIQAALGRLSVRAPETFDSVEPVTQALVDTIESASTSAFTVTTIVGALVAVYAASKVVLGLRMAMNAAFGVEETRSGLFERGLAAVVTLIGLIVGVAMIVLLTIVPQVLAWLELPSVPVSTGAPVVDWLIVVVLIFLATRWVLQHGPDRPARVAWRSAGAWTAAIGITAATVGVGIYTHFSASVSTAILVFGAAIVILLWLYLCFVALLWGAVIEAASERGRGVLGSAAEGAS